MNFEHFSLRLLQDGDAAAFYEVIRKNRSRLEDFFSGTVAKTLTPESTANYLSEILVRIKEKSYFPFFVIDNRNNSIAGFVDVKHIDWNIPKAELGCFADVDYEGKRISEKAMQKVIEHLLSDHKFLKLYLRTHAQNTSARRLAEKCGFQVEGTIRNDYRTTKGVLVDLMYYGLTPDSNKSTKDKIAHTTYTKP